MNKPTMRDLLQAGVHFGHQARYWNPLMAEYIYGTHNKIHIINLEKTLPLYIDVLNFVHKLVASGGRLLFVGTKRPARQVIAEQATRAGMPYVDYRWLGGMLTNYKTVRQSIKRLKDLESMAQNGGFEGLTKKEALTRTRQLEKLERSLGGIKNMGGIPDALFVVDVDYERIAVREARRLGIPVIGVVDTNSDPSPIDYVVPGNDDSTRAISLYIGGIVDVILEAQESLRLANPAPSEPEPVVIIEKKAKKVDLAPQTDSDQQAASVDQNAS